MIFQKNRKFIFNDEVCSANKCTWLCWEKIKNLFVSRMPVFKLSNKFFYLSYLSYGFIMSTIRFFYAVLLN